MGSIETRPSQNAMTSNNVQIGQPFVEIGLKTGTNTFDAYRTLGILSSSAIAKEIETVALRSSHSGTSVLVRELVRQFEARLNVETFEWSAENMQLAFASATSTPISAAVTPVVDEEVFLSGDTATWADLANPNVLESPSFVATCATITDEEVGTGDGTSGSSLGDFSLDFKPLDTVTDVASVSVGGVAFTPIAVGAASSGNEVEIEDYGDDTTNAGRMQFFVAGVAADVTGAILATYTPGHTLTENTTYAVDYQDGRIRALLLGATDVLKPNQPLFVDYSYNAFDGVDLSPYTQFVFEARARVRLLTDVGINIVWPIPSVNVRLTDDDVEFADDDFGSLALSVTLIDDGSATPYGTMSVYEEDAA